MKNKKFKVFVLFLDDNKRDKLRGTCSEVREYFTLTSEFNLDIEPEDVDVRPQYRTKRTGSRSSGLVVSSDSEEKLALHLEFIKKVLSRHLYYPHIPNVAFLKQVSKEEIYSKIPGAIDIKFTDDYYPIPMIVYDDGTTQALDCERLEKLTKIEHIVACKDSFYDDAAAQIMTHTETFFAS